MNQRCNDPDFSGAKNYSERGIKVCERWESFENFFADMGSPPEEKPTLDRYPNVDGDYCPENCRWASLKEQANNTRKNVFLTLHGQTLTIQQWSEELNIPHERIRGRLKLGMSTEQCLRVGYLRGR